MLIQYVIAVNLILGCRWRWRWRWRWRG